MSKQYSYQVAGFAFTVELPDSIRVEEVLPSFVPFEREGEAEQVLFRFSTQQKWEDAYEKETELWEKSEDDMGFTKLYRNEKGFLILLSYLRHGKVHKMFISSDLTEAVAVIDWTDPYRSTVVTSLLRIVYSQAILPSQAVALHAAVVMKEGEAALFMGKSGTGKSTHASLWLRHLTGYSLLNDDNPTVRLDGERLRVYGTPWSGKTPCYRNESAVVKGMVRLTQDPENRFVPVSDIAAFAALLPGCAVVSKEKRLYDALCETLIRMTNLAIIGRMYCLPDEAAAIICSEGLKMK